MGRKYKLSDFADPVQFLHIRCGEDILARLLAAGIPGDLLSWSDPLCEGPLLHREAPAARLSARAGYLASRFGVPMTETHRELAVAERRLSECVRYEETTLWFEADLFDQLILVYLLQRLAPFANRTRLSLICVGGFAGVPRFVGLGQLRGEQLAALWPMRAPVTRAQVALARRAWAALHDPMPRELNRLAALRSRALPFLPAAVARYLQEYPWVGDGLSLTERRALEAIAAGARTAVEAFGSVQDREERPFMGDAMFFAVLRDLAGGDYPVLSGGRRNLARVPVTELAETPLWLSALGERVLAGKADWTALANRDRWIGGVRLTGAEPRWRYDPTKRRAVEQRRRLAMRRRTRPPSRD
jgi:hypothetical protein